MWKPSSVISAWSSYHVKYEASWLLLKPSTANRAKKKRQNDTQKETYNEARTQWHADTVLNLLDAELNHSVVILRLFTKSPTQIHHLQPHRSVSCTPRWAEATIKWERQITSAKKFPYIIGNLCSKFGDNWFIFKEVTTKKLMDPSWLTAVSP